MKPNGYFILPDFAHFSSMIALKESSALFITLSHRSDISVTVPVWIQVLKNQEKFHGNVILSDILDHIAMQDVSSIIF